MSDNDKIAAYFKNAIKLNLLSHAYILLGSRGAGRLDCLRQILPDLLGGAGLASPDLKILEPSNDHISIDEIRALRFWLQQSPLTGVRKIAIIKSAESMGQEAQNAFLKILEEPPGHALIFLLAGHRRQLLPTIVSRTVPIYFSRPAGQFSSPRTTALQPWPLGYNPSGQKHVPPRVYAGGFPLVRGEQKIVSPSLAEISQSNSSADILQRWLELRLDKNKSRDWLESSLPQLRALLRDRVAGRKITASLIASIRTTIEAINNPKGQNWQLLCENLLLSI